MPLVALLLVSSLLACAKEKPAVTESKPPAKAARATRGRAAAPRDQEAKCLDRWLAERKLDPYGSREGTMYAGGTPLFDERTGRRVDRLEYVYKKHPEARAACAAKPAGR